VEISFDPQKNERNLRERNLDFNLAQEFDFGSATYREDRRKDYGEVRIRSLGYIRGSLHVLVFTMRGTVLRVISLRKANRKERSQYAKARP